MSPDQQGPNLISRIPFLLILFLIILLCLGFYGYSAGCGLLYTNDSFDYLRLAGNLAAGHSLTRALTAGQDSWPPLFSMILYLLNIKLGLSPAIIHLGVLLANGLMFYFVGIKVLKPSARMLVWFALTVLGVTFLMIHIFLWSEPIFLLILTGLVLATDQYLLHKKTFSLILVVVLLNLLCLQRNAGIIIVLAVSSAVFWYHRGIKGFLAGLLLLTAGSLSFVWWNIYLPWKFHVFPEIRHLSFFSGFGWNLLDGLNVMSAWFLPRRFYAFLRIPIWLAILALILISKKFTRNYTGIPVPALFMSLIYLILICSLGRTDPYEMERYLSVIYPFFLLGLLASSDFIFQPGNLRVKKILILLTALWLSYTAVRTGVNAVRWHASGCRQETTGANR